MKSLFTKRYSLLISLLACLACIGMLYTRFGLSERAIYDYVIMLVLLIALLLICAAVVAILLRWVMKKSDKETFDD